MGIIIFVWLLEDLGCSLNGISTKELLTREQFYLDKIFNSSIDTLNLAPTAGSNLGFKHSEQFKLNRTAQLNPMYGKSLSPEFIEMQTRDIRGILNPMYGKQKSAETLAKLQKLIYVYDSTTYNLIGTFPTVACSKHFKMGKDTLTKYLDTNVPFKGKLFYSKTME